IEKYLSQNPEFLFDLIVNYSNQKSEDAKQSAMSLTYDSEGDGTMGNPDASFIIYEYSDYNCGYCKRLFNTLQTLISEDDDLLIVVKEFPILAKSSVLAAKAALAAEEQGRFAEYHNALMTSVGGITQDSLQSIATMVGLDLSLYNEAISSNRFDKILQRNMDAGQAIGIEGTPALLIGEQIIPGAIGLAEIKALIKAEREKS
ncbi:MAG: DsbA family protein, partial [Alphaproteobacteria bacterium]